MRKLIITTCLVGSLLIILDSLQASHWLVLLLLAGVIPGTNISISPIDMMAAVATAMTIVILRATVWARLAAIFFTKPAKTKHQVRRIA